MATIFYDDLQAKQQDWLRQSGMVVHGSERLLLFSCPHCERFFAKVDQQHFPALSDDQFLWFASQCQADVVIENRKVLSAALPEQCCILCSLQKLGGLFTAQSCYSLTGQHLGYRFDWESPAYEQIICLVSIKPTTIAELLQATTTELLSPTRHVREVLETLARRASPICCRLCTEMEFQQFQQISLVSGLPLGNAYVFRLESSLLLLAGSEPPYDLLDRFRLLALCMSKELV